MAAATGVRGRCELPPCSGPGWLLSLSALLSMAARGAFATTHWVVTEDGKIQQQVEARESLPAGACPHSWGRFPGPTPDYLALRGPAPSLPSPLSLRPDLGDPSAVPSPLVSWPSLGCLQVLRLPTLGPRAAWGESPGVGGRALGT